MPGSYSLSAIAPGYAPSRTNLASLAAGQSGLKLALERLGQIAGQVKFRGKTWPNTPLTLHAETGFTQGASTDDQGHYRITGLPWGHYRIALGPTNGPWLMPAGFQISSLTNEVLLNFDLVQFAQLHGRVFDASRSSAATQATVRLWRGQETVAAAATDPAGNYSFLVFDPGSYSLSATAPGLLFSPLENLSVDADAERSGLDFYASTNRLVVRVRTAPGEPVAHARVNASLKADPARQELAGFTDSQGLCVLEGLPESVLRVAVQAEGYAREEQEITLATGQATAQFNLSQGRILEGIVDGEGGPLSKAMVTATDLDRAWSFTTVTGEQGAYRFDTLPPGRFEVAANALHPGYMAKVAATISTTDLPRQELDIHLDFATTNAVAGRVVDAAGWAVPDAQLRVLSAAGTELAATLQPGLGGGRMYGAPPGEFRLWAGATGYMPAQQTIAVSQDSPLAEVSLILAGPLAAPGSAFASLAAAPPGVALRRMSMASEDIATVFANMSGEISPEYYIENITPDLNQHYGLQDEAFKKFIGGCRGVDQAFEEADNAKLWLIEAKHDWIMAYMDFSYLNVINRKIVIWRGIELAFRLAKIGASISQLKLDAIDPRFKGFLGFEPDAGFDASPRMVAAYTQAISSLKKSYDVFENARQFGYGNKSAYDLAYQLAAMAQNTTAVINFLKQIKGKQEAWTKVAGLLFELLDFIKCAQNLYDDVNTMGQNSFGAMIAFQNAQDNYDHLLHRYLAALGKMKAAMRDCKTGGGTQPGMPLPPNLSLAEGSVYGVESKDPNAKLSTGHGPRSWLAAREEIVYTIEFENKSSATAPAQEVLITDQLSEALDWSTFELVEIAFNDARLDVPAGLQSYTAQAAVSSDPCPVRVQASLDPLSGMATWKMASFDPVTRDFPEDPLAGFLPPNDAGHHGEGRVVFRIRPRAGLVSGTEIHNQASIVFDLNSPIETGVVTNTIDSLPPSTRVSALIYRGGRQFELRWGGGGTDGSPIACYDIYVSRNHAPYQLWLQGTTADGCLFSADTGVNYRFYAQAIDLVGNRQSAPLSADVTTETFLLMEMTPGPEPELRWTSIPGGEYYIQQASEITGATSWRTIHGPIRAEGYLSSYKLGSVAEGRFYYRLLKSP